MNVIAGGFRFDRVRKAQLANRFTIPPPQLLDPLEGATVLETAVVRLAIEVRTRDCAGTASPDHLDSLMRRQLRRAPCNPDAAGGVERRACRLRCLGLLDAEELERRLSGGSRREHDLNGLRLIVGQE